MIVRYRDGELPAGDVDPGLAADFDDLPERLAAHIDRAELTVGLEAVWERVRRLNRYVEEQAPWQLAKDPERAGELERVLRSLAEGIRSVSVLLWPYLPDSCERLLQALGAPGLSLAGAGLGAGNVQRVSTIPSLFPKDAAPA